MAEVPEGAEINEGQNLTEVDKVRNVVADVYTFVRSAEINRTIASFTFDHYIDEAKRKLKGTGTAIRDAAGRSIGMRPTKLESLESLENEFQGSLKLIETLAKKADLSDKAEEEEE
jgi:hypothetical protein